MLFRSGPEAIIPLSAKRRGRANSLYDSVGKAIGADDGSKEMIRNQQIQIDRLDTAINVLLGIEDKTGITESDIGRANDKYNARQTSKRGATTGRLNYV